MARMQSQQPARAFTLIELLVVVSIIALLVSLLLPALGSARQTAITVQCGNQQRQAAVASMAYSEDFKSWLVPMRDYQTPTSAAFDLNTATWGQILLWQQYATDNGGLPFTARNPTRGLFRCPSTDASGSYHGTYGINVAITGTMAANDAPGNDWYGAWIRFTDISSPSETYLHGDSARQDAGDFYGTPEYQMRGKDLAGGMPMLRHMKDTVWTVIYADGHAETSAAFVADNSQPAIKIQWKGRP